MQRLKAEVIIEIPETHVLIEKVELEELKQRSNSEWVKGLEWLKEQTGIRHSVTLRENILYAYRDELEKFVNYPNNRGEHWY